MKYRQTDGIILKRTNIGDADRILTIFTSSLGKIYVKAKGIRKITSRRSAHVEVLNYSRLILYKNKHLPILTEATTLYHFPDIKNDLQKVGFAYHICELIDGLCPENQENSAIFTLLLQTLEALSKTNDVAVVVEGFEIELLSRLGYYMARNNSSYHMNTTVFIENILERRLKAKRILHKLTL